MKTTLVLLSASLLLGLLVVGIPTGFRPYPNGVEYAKINLENGNMEFHYFTENGYEISRELACYYCDEKEWLP